MHILPYNVRILYVYSNVLLCKTNFFRHLYIPVAEKVLRKENLVLKGAHLTVTPLFQEQNDPILSASQEASTTIHQTSPTDIECEKPIDSIGMEESSIAADTQPDDRPMGGVRDKIKQFQSTSHSERAMKSIPVYKKEQLKTPQMNTAFVMSKFSESNKGERPLSPSPPVVKKAKLDSAKTQNEAIFGAASPQESESAENSNEYSMRRAVRVDDEALTEPMVSDTVEITGLPTDTTKDGLTMFLENERFTGGTKVDSMNVDNGKAVVKFKNESGK